MIALIVSVRLLRSLVRNVFFFFFSSRRRHTRFDCDWSSECALPIWAGNEMKAIWSPVGDHAVPNSIVLGSAETGCWSLPFAFITQMSSPLEKAILRPSGDPSGTCPFGAGSKVNWVAPPPLVSIVHTWPFLMKTILLPSGDQAGKRSTLGPDVSCVAPLPSLFTTQISPDIWVPKTIL